MAQEQFEVNYMLKTNEPKRLFNRLFKGNK